MSSLLPSFSVSAPFGRAKRKLSSLEKGLSMDEIELTKQLSLGNPSLNTSSSSSSSSVVVTLRWCEICQTVDLKEVLGFAVFELLTVFVGVLGCLDWIFFFKFVVEPEDLETRAKWGSVWLVFTFCVLYFRALFRSKCDANMRLLSEHAEMFIAVSMVMVFAVNIAFMMHTPSSTPLGDLGFMFIPEQAIDSPWRPLSDILTAAMPVLFLAQAHFMTRENRCRVMTTFFRVATVNYALRMCTIALTSLPGPAPHCRPGSPNYLPPQTWIDIVTRIGPMYGNYNSCGDLIFSGHMAYTNTALLVYLRVLDRHFPRFSRARWTVGMLYLAVLAGLCIAGRKHYTVDVVLGIIISSLVFFHFEHGWTPLWMQPVKAIQVTSTSRRYLNGKRFASIEIHDDDDEDLEQAMDEYDDSDALLNNSTNGSKGSKGKTTSSSSSKHEPAEFIC